MRVTRQVAGYRGMGWMSVDLCGLRAALSPRCTSSVAAEAAGPFPLLGMP